MADQVTEQTEQELQNLATSDGVADAPPVEDGIVDNMIDDDEPIATTEQLEQAEQEPADAPAADPAAEPDEAGEPQMVPLAALHEAKEKHKSLRDDPEALERRLTELRAEQAPAAPSPAVEPAASPTAEPELKMPDWGKSDPDDIDPNTQVSADDIDIMSNSEILAHQNACTAYKERENTRRQRITSEIDNQRIDLDGRRRFTTQSMGAGFDYVTVLKTGGQHLSQGDLRYVRNSKDPAKVVYDLCIERCPSLKYMKENSAKPSANLPPNTPANQTQNQPEPEPENEEPRMTLDVNDRTPQSIADSLVL